MRVRKSNDFNCTKCFFNANNKCAFGTWECLETIPEDAYFEKPNVGGKDQHK